MQDARKTKKQLIEELSALRRQAAGQKNGGCDPPAKSPAVDDHPDIYRIAAECSNDGIIITNRNQRLYCNQKYLELTGYKCPEEISEKPFLFAVHPDDQEMVQKIIRRRQSGENAPIQYECRFCRPDGSIIYVEISSSLISYRGEPASLGYVRDITKRAQAEERLAAIQDRFSAAFRLSPVSLSFSDVETSRLIDVNDAFTAITGYRRDEAIGKTSSDLMLWRNTNVRQRFLSLLETQGECVGVITKMRVRDGTLKDIRISSKILSLSGTSQLFSVIEDLTEIRKQEARFTSLIEKSADVITILDGNGLFLYNTPSAELVFGYPPEYLIGKSAFDFIHPDDLEAAAGDFSEVAANLNDGIPSEFRFRKSDGSWVYLETRGTNLLHDPGIGGIVITSREITERKRTEAALRESEGMFRDLAEKTIVGIYLIQDNLLKYVNSEFAEIFGYSVDEIAGKLSPRDIIFPEDWPLVEQNILQRIAGVVKSLRYEFRILTKDHKIKYAEIYSSRTMYQGQPAIIGTLLDITNRKKAEEELKRLSVAVEQAAEDIIIVDTDGIIQYVNPAFEKITGYSRAEAIGRTPNIVKSGVHEPAFYENLWNTIKGGQIWTGRITNKRKDGQLIQEDATISPLLGAAGQLTGYVSLKRDVTEQVKIEGQLIHAQKMESIGTLSSGIAHDFNNILSGILGQVTLMLFGLNENHPHYKKLQSIDRQVMSGANLTRQLLGFARGVQYEVKSTDLNVLLEKSSEMFGRTKKGVSISKRLQDDIWPVEADQGQIDQVLLNLFINAAHAMSDEGEIDLETRNIDLTDAEAMPYGVHGGRYVKLSVTDSGTGMDQATMQRIFEPFFTTKGPGIGTGLGLASAYGIIKNHGGFITVYSEPGQGTTFNIHLPATGTGVTPDDEASEIVVRGHETILVVDDEQIYLTVTRQILENIGYRVFTAGSGQEAIAVFMEKQKQIDLVLLDMVMPGMGGRRAFEALREINPDLKIIIASGYSINREVQQLLDQGGNGFIQKPYRVQELSKILRKVF